MRSVIVLGYICVNFILFDSTFQKNILFQTRRPAPRLYSEVYEDDYCVGFIFKLVSMLLTTQGSNQRCVAMALARQFTSVLTTKTVNVKPKSAITQNAKRYKPTIHQQFCVSRCSKSCVARAQ